MADFDEAETDWFADIEQAINGSDAAGHLYDPQQPSTSAAFYESAAGVSATIDFTSLADVPIDEATYYEFREFIADERHPHPAAGSSQQCAVAEMAPSVTGAAELQAAPPYNHQHQLPPPLPGEGQASVAAAEELGPSQSRDGGNWAVSDQAPVLMDMKPMMRPPPPQPAQLSYDVEGTDAAYHSYHQYHPASSAQMPPSDYINLDHQQPNPSLSASAIDMSQVPPDPVTRSNKNKRVRPSRQRGPRQRSAPKSALEEEESPTFSLDAVITRLFSASGEAAIRFTAEMNAEFASCVQQYKELEAKQFATGLDYTPRLRNIEKRIAALVSAAEPATTTPSHQASISQKSTPRKRPGARPLPITASSSIPTMQPPQPISTPIPALTIGPGGQLQFFSSSQAPGDGAALALNGATPSSLQGQTVVVDYGQGPQVMTMVATAPSIPLEQISTLLPAPTYSAHTPGGARKSRTKAASAKNSVAQEVVQPPQTLPATPQFIVIGSSATAPPTVPMTIDVAEPTPPSARAKAQRRVRPRPTATTATRESSKALAIPQPSPPPPPLKRVVPTVGELMERVSARREECRYLLNAKFDTIRQSMARTDYQTPFTDRHDSLQRLLPYAFLLEPDLGDEVIEAFDHQFLRHSLSMEARWKDCEERMRKLLYSDAMGTASTEELNMLLQLDVEYERRELSSATTGTPYQSKPATDCTSSSLSTHFPNFEYHEWCPEVYYKAAANYGYIDFPPTPTDECTSMGGEKVEQYIGTHDLKEAVSPQSPVICMGEELKADFELLGTPETALAMDYGIEESDKDEPEPDDAEFLSQRNETPSSPLLPPPPPPPTGGLKLKIRLPPPPPEPSPAPNVQAEEDAENVSERRLAKLERRRKRKEEKRRSREHAVGRQGQCPSPNSESVVRSHRLPTPCWSTLNSKETTAVATSTSAASPTSSSVVGARREAKGLKLFVPKFLLSRPLPSISDSPSPSSSSTSGGGAGRGRSKQMSRATPSRRCKVNATPRTRKDPAKLTRTASNEAPAAKVVPKLKIRFGPKPMTGRINGEAEQTEADFTFETLPPPTPAAGSSLSSNPASNQTLMGVAGMETSPLGLAHINAIQANLMQSVMACGRGLSPPPPYGAATSSVQSGANAAPFSSPSSSKHPTTVEKSHVQFSPCGSDDSDDERLRAETIHLLTKLQ